MAQQVSTPLVSAVVESLQQEQTARGMTDMEMATELGISQTAWSYMKRGRRGVGLEALCRLATKRTNLLTVIVPFFRQLGDRSAPNS